MLLLLDFMACCLVPQSASFQTAKSPSTISAALFDNNLFQAQPLLPSFFKQVDSSDILWLLTSFSRISRHCGLLFAADMVDGILKGDTTVCTFFA